jgi:hypothetical protein
MIELVASPDWSNHTTNFVSRSSEGLWLILAFARETVQESMPSHYKHIVFIKAANHK